MKFVLITGMSGTGKTSTTLELQAQGYKAIDLDSDAFSIWIDAESNLEYSDNEVKPGRDWVWNEERVRDLVATQGNGLTFMSGCASNMSKFYPDFDYIILLTAPESII